MNVFLLEITALISAVTFDRDQVSVSQIQSTRSMLLSTRGILYCVLFAVTWTGTCSWMHGLLLEEAD